MQILRDVLHVAGGRAKAFRAGFFVAATLCIAGAGPHMSARRNAAIAVPGGLLQLFQQGDRTMITLRDGSAVRHLTLAKEEGIYGGAEPSTALVGALPGHVLILRSDYASNPSGGAYQCGAGTETVVRVIALHPALHQTFSERIASCWNDIEEGDLDWNARTQTLTVERTMVDVARHGAPVRDLRAHYRVESDGKMTPGLVDDIPG